MVGELSFLPPDAHIKAGLNSAEQNIHALERDAAALVCIARSHSAPRISNLPGCGRS
jgi:hypothetical protein